MSLGALAVGRRDGPRLLAREGRGDLEAIGRDVRLARDRLAHRPVGHHVADHDRALRHRVEVVGVLAQIEDGRRRRVDDDVRRRRRHLERAGAELRREERDLVDAPQRHHERQHRARRHERPKQPQVPDAPAECHTGSTHRDERLLHRGCARESFGWRWPLHGHRRRRRRGGLADAREDDRHEPDHVQEDVCRVRERELVEQPAQRRGTPPRPARR